MHKQLVVFGASNILGDIFECALALGCRPVLVVTNVPELADPRGKNLAQRLSEMRTPPRTIDLAEFKPSDGELYTLGTGAEARDQLADEVARKFGIRFTALIHPAAYIPPSSNVQEGAFVGAGSVIGSGAEVGRLAFVNRGVTVGHDTVVGPFARLMPGCNVAGLVKIGYGATIGMGANVLQRLEIGARAFVAAGAVVTRDVPAEYFAAGNPAKIRQRERTE